MRKIALIAAVFTLLICVSLGLGAASLNDTNGGWLIMVSRFPRTAAALLAGAGLALAGVVVQQMFQNRLVEPSMTGTPESAMLGLLAITLVAPQMSVSGKMIFATLSALLGMLLFLALSTRIPRQDPLLLPIVGMVFGGILDAASTYFAWQTDLMQYLGIWRTGEFSGVMQGRYELLWGIAVCATLLYFLADRITLLGFGDVQARSLGLNYTQTRLVGLVIVSIMIALVLVTVGTFMFVGLVAPNLISRLRGDNIRSNLPYIALLGSGLILTADIVGRLVVFPFEIPASTIYAVFGAAVFLWMLHGKTAKFHG